MPLISGDARRAPLSVALLICSVTGCRLLESRGPTPTALDAGVDAGVFDAGPRPVCASTTTALDAGLSASAIEVVTVAGSGVNAFRDGRGQSAEFNGPVGVAVDPEGDVFIADAYNARVRLVDLSHNVSTVAGNGVVGVRDGTGGPTGTAEFADPTGIAADTEGNLFVADLDNNRIRRIDVFGNVTTFAGTGFIGDADGPGDAATFNDPYGIASDGRGSLYVTERGGNVVRRIESDGHVTTIAGTGQRGFADGANASFNTPAGVAVDAWGFVYVADSGNNRVRVIGPDGVVGTLAGNGTDGFVDGPMGTAELSRPVGVAVDAHDNVFVAELGNSSIRMIDVCGNISTLAGNGVPGFADGTGGARGTAELFEPYGVAVGPVGALYVADFRNNRIRLLQLPPLTGEPM